MSQCHDEYMELEKRYSPAEQVRAPEGTQCHDVPEISVLIADSDDSTRSRIRQVLADDQRFGPVSEVTAGDEALRRCEEVDVVLVGLRTRNGLGALGTINRIARRPSRPRIVAIAPKGEEWLSLAARTEGADEVIEWPQEAPQLARRLVPTGNTV